MRVKVICAMLTYGNQMHREGDYIEVENDTERQMLIQERCVVEAQVIKKKIIPSSDTKTRGGAKRK